MIEEQGKVIAVDSDKVTIECITRSACSACASKKSCSSGVVSNAFGEQVQHFYFDKQDQGELNSGDQVTIGIAEQSLLQGAFLVYLLPLFSFILAALFADIILHTPELITIISAFIAGGLAYLLSRHLLAKSKQSLQPILLQKARFD